MLSIAGGIILAVLSLIGIWVVYQIAISLVLTVRNLLRKEK